MPNSPAIGGTSRFASGARRPRRRGRRAASPSAPPKGQSLAKSVLRPHRAAATWEVSAGGVVVRRIAGRVHVALLKAERSRGKVWILPKGHVERQRGETPEEAAIREVKEELGITDVQLRRKLGTTQFQFFAPSGRIVKTVHYFLMEGRSHDLNAEDAEGILEARWLPVRDALRYLTYPAEREIVLRGVASKKRARTRASSRPERS